MSTDSYYEMGHSHEQCQDYAISGETDNVVYSVVADGCSESPRSDVGARLVAHSFIESVKVLGDLSALTVEADKNLLVSLESILLNKLRIVGNELGISLRAMDATLVAAVYSKAEKALRLYMYGDGNIVLGYPDGTILYSAHYSHHAPYYLSYRLNEQRRKDYLNQFGSPEALVLTTSGQENFRVTNEGEYHESFYHKLSELGSLQYALVSSDGMDSFTVGNTEERLPVFKEFTSFKSFNGEFVKRRMKRFRQETKAAGNQHFDDISSAAISFV